MNRNPDYTHAMEYDKWESAPLQRIGPGTFTGQVIVPRLQYTIDFVSVHQHTANGSTLTVSSPLVRTNIR